MAGWLRSPSHPAYEALQSRVDGLAAAELGAAAAAPAAAGLASQQTDSTEVSLADLSYPCACYVGPPPALKSNIMARSASTACRNSAMVANSEAAPLNGVAQL